VCFGQGFFDCGNLPGLPGDVLLGSPQLCSSRTQMRFKLCDSHRVLLFRSFKALLPLFGFLPRAVDLLVRPIFNRTDIRILPQPFFVKRCNFLLELRSELSQ
jgi:hypothetical protein